MDGVIEINAALRALISSDQCDYEATCRVIDFGHKLSPHTNDSVSRLLHHDQIYVNRQEQIGLFKLWKICEGRLGIAFAQEVLYDDGSSRRAGYELGYDIRTLQPSYLAQVAMCTLFSFGSHRFLRATRTTIWTLSLTATRTPPP